MYPYPSISIVVVVYRIIRRTHYNTPYPAMVKIPLKFLDPDRDPNDFCGKIFTKIRSVVLVSM